MPAEGCCLTARERETQVMWCLAEAILAGALFNMDRVPGGARQLGYVASLARGRALGCEAALDAIILLCRAAAEEEPEARTVQYRDRMQALGGSLLHGHREAPDGAASAAATC